MKVAGPFEKEYKARKVSKTWSEVDSETDDENLGNRRKRRDPLPLTFKRPDCHSLINTENSQLSLPKPPKTVDAVLETNTNFHYISDSDSSANSNNTSNMSSFAAIIEDFMNNINNPIDTHKITNITNTHSNENNPNNLVNVNELNNFIKEANASDFEMIGIDNDNGSMLNELDINGDDILNASQMKENSHADNYINLITIIEKNDKHYKSTLKKLMMQMVLLSNSNVKLCKGLTSMDAKLHAILKADTRTRALALPMPIIPIAFIDLLPVKTVEQLEIAEFLLSVENEDGIILKENLKSFLLQKVRALSISVAVREAINYCFDYPMLSMYSLEGKTKKKFVDLQLFSVIYESLSGLRIHPADEQKFMSVLDNYLRHAPKIPTINP